VLAKVLADQAPLHTAPSIFFQLNIYVVSFWIFVMALEAVEVNDTIKKGVDAGMV